MSVEIKKMIGGGESWFYAIDKRGKVLGASHQDDREGMARLREIKKCRDKYDRVMPETQQV